MKSSKDPLQFKTTPQKLREIKHICALPDGRRLFCFDGGAVAVIPSGESPENFQPLVKLMQSAYFDWIAGSRVLVGYSRINANFAMNIDTKQKEIIDERFGNVSHLSVANLKAQDGTDYFVLGTKNMIILFKSSDLNKPIFECQLEGKAEQSHVNCLAVSDDKIVAGIGRGDTAKIAVLSIQDGVLKDRYFSFSATDKFRPEFALNGKYMAVYERNQVNFGIFHPEGVDLGRECFEPKYPSLTLAVHPKGIHPVEGTPCFYFTDENDLSGFKLVNLESGTIQTIPLPIQRRGGGDDVILSANGLISYISFDRRIVELPYKPQALKLVTDLVSYVTAPDPAKLVGAYVGPIDIGEVSLSKKEIENVMSKMKITQGQLEPKEQKEDKTLLQVIKGLFSTQDKPKDLSQLSFIKKVLEEPNDATRYMMAYEYVSQHKENAFAQALAKVMSPSPDALQFSPEMLAKFKSQR